MDEKDAIDATTKILTEVAKEQSKEIYSDALKPALQETGGVLQSVVGLFNHVVLYPVKRANLTYRYKLEAFESDLNSKIKNIPPGKLAEPPLSITGPTIEALKYTFDTKEIRELYLELLASAMNEDKVEHTHSAYVEIIKAMNSLDAVILNQLATGGQAPAAMVKITFEDKRFTNATPTIFAPTLIGKYDPFHVSRSIENLCRLGLVTYDEAKIRNFDYETMKQHPFIISKMEYCKSIQPEKDLSIEVNPAVLYLNDFGKSFCQSCIPES